MRSHSGLLSRSLETANHPLPRPRLLTTVAIRGRVQRGVAYDGYRGRQPALCGFIAQRPVDRRVPRHVRDALPPKKGRSKANIARVTHTSIDRNTPTREQLTQ